MKTLYKILVLGLLLSAYQPLFSESEAKKCHNHKYEKQLKNTVWIVPPSTLLAYEYINGTNVPVSDQTVWVINEYNKGYFFGDSYTALNGSASSQRRLLGSITPEGNVYITFIPLSSSTQDTDIVHGVGTFEKQNGKYFFVMQMDSAQNSLTGLSHWSYMISVKPNDYYYQHLPGLDISVPDFISEF